MSNQEKNEAIMNSNTIQSLANEFADYENSPDGQFLKHGKQHMVVFVSSILGEEDMYVWRTINGTEYKQLVNSGVVKIQSTYEKQW